MRTSKSPISGDWHRSLRAQIGISVLAVFLVLALTLGYTTYALQLRKNDYLILNLTGQLRVISINLQQQATHYLMQAPDSYEKYDRDLGTYWQDLQKQLALFESIIRSLESGQFDVELTGREETSHIIIDDSAHNELERAAAGWNRFKSGLYDKLGADPKEPRLTWAAEYITEHGSELDVTANQLTTAFQGKMEQKLSNIRLYQWGALLSSLLLLAMLMRVVQREILRPVSITLSGFERVSRGDFSHPVPVIANNEIGNMTASFNLLTERLNAMFRLTDRITQGKKLDEMLRFVHEEFQQFVPLDWVGVFYRTHDVTRITLERYFSSRPSQMREGELFNLHHNCAELYDKPGAVSLSGSPPQIECQLENRLAQDGLTAAAYLPLLRDGETRAIMVFARAGGEYQPEHIDFLSNIAAVISHVLDKTVVMESLVAAAIQGLAKLAESRDPETGNHLVRMAHYSALIAEELGRSASYLGKISPAFVREIYHFAPMHDIGKVGVRDDVLLKAGSLDIAERQEMERHPLIGGEVLRRAEAQVKALGHSMFQVGIEIAEGHHEKFDGSGYPYGVKGIEIPLSARIVAAADVFDALTSKRPYKEAWTIEAAMDAMQKAAGKHFDPEIIAAMHRAMPRMLEIYERLKHI